MFNKKIMGNIFKRSTRYNKLQFLDDVDYDNLNGDQYEPYKKYDYKNADNLELYNYENIIHNIEKYIKDINCKINNQQTEIIKLKSDLDSLLNNDKLMLQKIINLEESISIINLHNNNIYVENDSVNNYKSSNYTQNCNESKLDESDIMHNNNNNNMESTSSLDLYYSNN